MIRFVDRLENVDASKPLGAPGDYIPPPELALVARDNHLRNNTVRGRRRILLLIRQGSRIPPVCPRTNPIAGIVLVRAESDVEKEWRARWAEPATFAGLDQRPTDCDCFLFLGNWS